MTMRTLIVGAVLFRSSPLRLRLSMCGSFGGLRWWSNNASCPRASFSNLTYASESR
jgi:hypothetical protein